MSRGQGQAGKLKHKRMGHDHRHAPTLYHYPYNALFISSASLENSTVCK